MENLITLKDCDQFCEETLKDWDQFDEKTLRFLIYNLGEVQGILVKAQKVLEQFGYDIYDEDNRKELDVQLKNLEKSIPKRMIPSLAKGVRRQITRARMNPDPINAASELDNMCYISDGKVEKLKMILAEKELVTELTTKMGDPEIAKKTASELMMDFQKGKDTTFELT